MKFSCEKNLLVSAISVASRTVAMKSAIPALEGIYIRAGVKVMLSGYNLETGITVGVVADIRAANEHYAQYEGKVQDAAQKVNDTYLKAFSEESGVQSYGEAADLLIAWYLKNNA